MYLSDISSVEILKSQYFEQCSSHPDLLIQDKISFIQVDPFISFVFV